MKEQLLTTRSATDSDLEYVWKVYKEAVKSHIEPKLKQGWVDANELTNFRKAWKPANSHIIMMDSVPIGWGGVVVTPTEASIEHLYIEPAHRGKGYGTRLISEMLQVWRKEGKAVHAPVLKGSRAIGAATRLGFEKRTDSDQPLVDLLTYQPK
jgi:GNAT superfamily N-acetyltransferase